MNEYGDLSCFDDEQDMCVHCGHYDFFADDKEYVRVCTNCGATSCFEASNTEGKFIPYFYKPENYFINVVIHNAVMRGAPINQYHQERLVNMFARSVNLFHQVKGNLKRRNYPNYQYALLRLCRHIGVDVSKYVTLPKMQATLELVIEHWPYIDPTRN